ncbi:Uncharacterised protein [Streptococcus pneumoniae]|nr:Uncharacterised protein [Streptococcus pneumoniae]
MKKAMVIINPTSVARRLWITKKSWRIKQKNTLNMLKPKLPKKRWMQHILLKKLLVSSMMQWLCLVEMELSMKSFQVLMRETTFLS